MLHIKKPTIKPTVQRKALLALICLAVIVGSLLFIGAFGQKSFQCASLNLTLHSRPATSGGTMLVVPPVGRVFFKTHSVPWQLVFNLDEVDFKSLETELGSLPQGQWAAFFQDQILRVFLQFILRIVCCGLLGGLLILVILRVTPFTRRFWAGMLISFLTVLILIGSICATFDINALQQPQFQGALAAAPWVMNLISNGLNNIELVGANLRKVSGAIPLLYKEAGRLENLEDLPSDLRVLHISDIHNNPAAFEFIAELARDFQVNLIIDTGDLTDYGTALEATIIPKISQLKLPYVFVPGNHDTPLIIKRLKHVPNLHLLLKDTVRIDGLTIAGLADPASFSFSSDVAPQPQMDKAKAQLQEMLARLNPKPDLVAIHNRYLDGDLVGNVPVLLHGHDHRYRITERNSTTIIDAGTTGAAGMRGLDEKPPFSAAILYWTKDKTDKLQLRMVESIRINGYQGMMTIDRRVLKSVLKPPRMKPNKAVEKIMFQQKNTKKAR